MSGDCTWTWGGGPTGSWVGPTDSTCGVGFICDPVPPPSFPVPADGTQFFKACIPDTGPPANQIPPSRVGTKGTSVLSTYDPSAGNGVIIAPDLTQFTTEQRAKGLTFALKNIGTSIERITLQSANGISLIEHPDAQSPPAVSQFVQGSGRATTWEYDAGNDTWLCRPEFNPQTSFLSAWSNRDGTTDINSGLVGTPVSIPLALEGLDSRPFVPDGNGALVAQIAFSFVSLEVSCTVECSVTGNNNRADPYLSWDIVTGSPTVIGNRIGSAFIQSSRNIPLSDPGRMPMEARALLTDVSAGDVIRLVGWAGDVSTFDAMVVTQLTATTDGLL